MHTREDTRLVLEVVQGGKLEVDNERYFAVKKTNKEDALKKLFGED